MSLYSMYVQISVSESYPNDSSVPFFEKQKEQFSRLAWYPAVHRRGS